MSIDYTPFWTGMLQRIRGRTTLHSHLTAGNRNWLATQVGKGLSLSYLVRARDTAVALYIDGGPGSKEANEQVFDLLHRAKADIEHAYGAPLCWERLDGGRACRIQGVLPGGGMRDPERWPEIQEALLEAMLRFEAALRPHLPKRSK